MLIVKRTEEDREHCELPTDAAFCLLLLIPSLGSAPPPPPAVAQGWRTVLLGLRARKGRRMGKERWSELWPIPTLGR